MELSVILRKGIAIRTQQPGLPEDGPITPSLKALSRVKLKKSMHIGDKFLVKVGQPLSPVGADLAHIIAGRSVRVLFVHTAGEGITPWRGLIMLDSEYLGDGQIRSPATIGLVAHELTHVLQREFGNPYYWPSGRLRPTLTGRWIGDSTNYMEVLSLLVGWTVEHDIIASRVLSSSKSSIELVKEERLLASLRDRIATLSGSNPRNACRLVLKHFPGNLIYRQNFKVENRSPDGRIPPGSWHYWLRQMGFSRQAVDHIMIIASQGRQEWIEPDQIT
jgi:hypothetical protein